LTLAIIGLSSILRLQPIKANGAIMKFTHIDIAEDNMILTSIYLEPSGNEVNSIIANFTYSSDLLEVVEIQKDYSMFSNFTSEDFSLPGIIYIGAYSDEPVDYPGEVVRIKFKPKANGEAKLEFTQDAAAFGSGTPQEIPLDTESSTYTINNLSESLPETGMKEDILSLNALIALIGIAMIVIFVFAGVSMWGGIYISLGKWKGEFRGEIGIKGKDKGKKKKTSSKAKKKK
jgi:hypothetical protein